MIKKLAFGFVLAILLGIASIQAQAPVPSAAKRTVLLKYDLAPMQAMTTYIVEGEIVPGAESGWHTHPGHLFEYARSGEATLEVEGKSPQTVKPGMGFHLEPGVAHNARASKAEPYKFVIVFLLEPGKTILSPAPAPTK